MQNHCIWHHLLDCDVVALKAEAQTIAHNLIAEYEVIGCREHTSICANRHLNLALVNLVAQWLHREYNLLAIRELNALHTAIKLIDIALSNLVATIVKLILNIHQISDLHAADKVARESCVGLRYLHAKLCLDTLLSGDNSLANHLTILNTACINTVNRL